MLFNIIVYIHFFMVVDIDMCYQISFNMSYISKISSGTTVSISGTKGAFGKAGSGNAAALARVGLPPAEEAAAAVDAPLLSIRRVVAVPSLKI